MTRLLHNMMTGVLERAQLDTRPKINIEPENDGLVQMIFLFLSGARILR